MRTVVIKLHFGKGKTQDAEIETDKVPTTLILDALKTISTHFEKQVVQEAEEMVPESEMEAYINARLKVDRLKEDEL